MELREKPGKIKGKCGFFAGKSSGGVNLLERMREMIATSTCAAPEAKSRNCVLLKGYARKEMLPENFIISISTRVCRAL